MRSKGFSLIELTISIMVIGIVMYAGIAIFITSGVKGSRVEIFSVAQSLAEGKLEEVMAQSFDLLTDEAQTGYSGDLTGYTHTVNVDYVAASDLNTAVATQTAYKRVQVDINHPNLWNTIQLQSIKGSY